MATMTWYLPECDAQAIFGRTATGAIRKRPTKKQVTELARQGLSVEEYSGKTGQKSARTLDDAARERARASLEVARKRRMEVRSRKIKLLESKYGPDWKEQGHKIGDVSAAEALAGAIAEADESDDPLESIRVREMAAQQEKVGLRRTTKMPLWASDLRAQQQQQIDLLAEKLGGLLDAVKTTRAPAPAPLRPPPPETPEPKRKAAPEPEPEPDVHPPEPDVHLPEPARAADREDSVTPARYQKGRLW
jgi:hypothetical protein